MNDIDVSIVIPVYNVEEYIVECMESVISQDAKCAIECILVDDRGDDRSIEYAHEVTDGYGGGIEFRYITHDRNKGVSAARNTGIREARGKYVFFIDPDDIITPDCISALMKKAGEYPEAQIVTGDNRTFPIEDTSKGLSFAGKNFPEYSDDRRWIKSVLLTKFPVVVWNKLIKTEFIKSNNLFLKEGIIKEDNLWHIRAYDKVEAVAFVHKVTYLYRIRQGSLTVDYELRGKSIDSIRAICDELVTRDRKWDVGWAKCVRDFLSALRYFPERAERSAEARKLYEEYTDIIQKRDEVPLAVKLLFRYWEKKSPESNEKVFNTLFNLYWYLNDIARFRRPMI